MAFPVGSQKRSLESTEVPSAKEARLAPLEMFLNPTVDSVALLERVARFLPRGDLFNFSLASRFTANVSAHAMRSNLYEDHKVIMQKLKPLIDKLPEEERKQAFALECVTFSKYGEPSPGFNPPFATLEDYNKNLQLKVAGILHRCLSLPPVAPLDETIPLAIYILTPHNDRYLSGDEVSQYLINEILAKRTSEEALPVYRQPSVATVLETLAYGIKSSKGRSQAFQMIVHGLLLGDDLVVTREAVQGITDTFIRSVSLLKIAKIDAGINREETLKMIRNAFRDAMQIEDSTARGAVFVGVIEELIQEDALAVAEDTVKKIPDAFIRALSSLKIARAETDPERVLRMLEDVLNDVKQVQDLEEKNNILDDRNRLLEDVSRRYIDGNRLPEAFDVAKRMLADSPSYGYRRALMMRTISAAYVHAGNLQQAVDVIVEAGFWEMYYEASRYSREGNMDAAVAFGKGLINHFNTIDDIHNSYDLNAFILFAKIINMYLSVNDVANATSVTQYVRDSINEISDPVLRCKKMVRFIETFKDEDQKEPFELSEMLKEVADTVTQISEESLEKNELLSNISEMYASRNDLVTSLNIARKMRNIEGSEWVIAWRMKKISKAYANKDELKIARDLLIEIPDDFQRHIAFSEAVGLYLEKGDIPSAILFGQQTIQFPSEDWIKVFKEILAKCRACQDMANVSSAIQTIRSTIREVSDPILRCRKLMQFMKEFEDQLEPVVVLEILKEVTDTATQTEGDSDYLDLLLEELSKIYESKGDLKTSLDFALRMDDSLYNTARRMRDISTAYVREGQLEMARDVLLKTSNDFFNFTADDFFHLVSECMTRGNKVLVMDILNEMDSRASKQPQNIFPGIWCRISETYQSIGELQLARDSLTRALDITIKLPGIFYNAPEFNQMGDSEEVLRKIEVFLEDNLDEIFTLQDQIRSDSEDLSGLQAQVMALLEGLQKALDSGELESPSDQ